jgi:hypothetical protein
MHYKATSKLFVGLFCLATALGYVACQKAVPAPYSDPQYGLGTGTVKTTSEPSAVFQCSINNVPTIGLAPSTAIGNGQVQLIGTNASYTVTVNFPNTTGPGHYFLGSTEGFGGSVNNGADVYSVTYHGSGLGDLQIDSISHGKYYGSFSLNADDPSHNYLSVNSGVFSNL